MLIFVAIRKLVINETFRLMPSLSFAILVVIFGSCLESLCLLNAGCVVLDRCDVSLENHLEEHHYKGIIDKFNFCVG